MLMLKVVAMLMKDSCLIQALIQALIHGLSLPCLNGLVNDVPNDRLFGNDTSEGLSHLVNDVLVVNLGDDGLDDLLDERLLLNSLEGLAVINCRKGLFV